MITEEDSLYNELENKSVKEILIGINTEDKKVALAVEKAIPYIETLIEAIVVKIEKGGRLFYLGSGTSGRLGVLDAAECPPTFGVDRDKVIGLIAGGEKAIKMAVEYAEDDLDAGWVDLQKQNITISDFVIGISASGTTPYVLGALLKCKDNGIQTGSIVCNPKSEIAKASLYPIEVLVGPEFITGSTRMKSGTAQKLVLNMISTSCMIKLGRIQDNKMIDLQLNNKKLIDRGARIIQQKLSITYDEAKKLLIENKSVRAVLAKYGK